MLPEAEIALDTGLPLEARYAGRSCLAHLSWKLGSTQGPGCEELHTNVRTCNALLQ